MEDEFNMDMFGSNDDFELNYDLNPDGLLDDDTTGADSEDDDVNPFKEIKTVEGEGSEEVDGEEDDQDEGNEDSDDDDSDTSSSNLYSSVAAVLYEQGLLPSLDIDNAKINTPEEFAEAFKAEMEIRSKQLTEDYLSGLDLENITRNKAEIKDLESIDEDYLKSNLEVAKQIIYEDYLNQGLTEAKAGRMLNRLVDLGEDAILEDAQESISSLKEFKARNIEAERANYESRQKEMELEQANREALIKKTVFDRKDLINGYTPSKALQDKVYKTMNDVVGKSPEGHFENKFMKERRESPVEFETKMYYFYELTNGFNDFSKISTKAKSSAVNDLEKIIKSGAYKDAGTPSFMSDKNSYDSNLGDELNL